jgi:hypothetical protein
MLYVWSNGLAELRSVELVEIDLERCAGDFGISPVSIAEIPHLVERSASRLC